MADMHPRGNGYQGSGGAFVACSVTRQQELAEELEEMLQERARVFAMLRKACSTVALLEDRLRVADDSSATRKAVSDRNRERYFHSLFYYDWKPNC